MVLWGRVPLRRERTFVASSPLFHLLIVIFVYRVCSIYGGRRLLFPPIRARAAPLDAIFLCYE